ncbi:MAG: hypothetical protein VX546_04515 [Myxococcota bacterium]|nr:hypothetical protein [Myxococcota bacterium]
MPVFHYANPPILVEKLIENVDEVVALFERNAPYTPLGGWYRPDHGGEALSPMWFQNDWVHADFQAEGSELFLQNERFSEAARRFYDAEVVIPHSVYVNLMVAIAESGPAHTDNPFFRGRNRTNTPMMLLRTMLWSGLFDHWVIDQATAIWWLSDVEGGGFSYWPDGPDKPPHCHVGQMANTALVGDNHGMFHQVDPVGPFDEGTRMVAASSQLAPAGDGSGDWVVNDRGKERFRAPLEQYRASVLWKAHVFSTEEERRAVENDTLSFEDVARVFNADLAARDLEVRFDLERIEDPAHTAALAAVYPEAVPIGAGVSVFEAHA